MPLRPRRKKGRKNETTLVGNEAEVLDASILLGKKEGTREMNTSDSALQMCGHGNEGTGTNTQTAPEEELKPNGQSDFENAWRECAGQVFLDNTARAFFGRGWDAASRPLLPEGGEGETAFQFLRRVFSVPGTKTLEEGIPTLTIGTIMGLMEDFARHSLPSPGEGVGEEVMKEMQNKADAVYLVFIDQCRESECLGWEAKVKAGEFGKKELDAHNRAGELYGKHLAYSDAANILSRHLPKKG